MENLKDEIPGNTASVAKVDMKLEVVVIPVSDLDRAKAFYLRLGWRLDIDVAAGTSPQRHRVPQRVCT